MGTAPNTRDTRVVPDETLGPAPCRSVGQAPPASHVTTPPTRQIAHAPPLRDTRTHPQPLQYAGLSRLTRPIARSRCRGSASAGSVELHRPLRECLENRGYCRCARLLALPERPQPCLVALSPAERKHSTHEFAARNAPAFKHIAMASTDLLGARLRRTPDRRRRDSLDRPIGENGFLAMPESLTRNRFSGLNPTARHTRPISGFSNHRRGSSWPHPGAL